MEYVNHVAKLVIGDGLPPPAAFEQVPQEGVVQGRVLEQG